VRAPWVVVVWSRVDERAGAKGSSDDEAPTSIFQSQCFRRNRSARFLSIRGRTSSLADGGMMESRHQLSESFFPNPLWLSNFCSLPPPRTLSRPRSHL